MFIPDTAVNEITLDGPLKHDDPILRSDQPYIIRGLASGWPLVREGLKSPTDAMNYIEKFYRGRPVTAFVAPRDTKGLIAYTDDCTRLNFNRHEVPLKNVLDELKLHLGEQHAKTYYIGSTDVNHYLPGFREYNDFPLKELNPLMGIWIGNRSRIPAHFDFPDNIACSAVGKRRFTLFPPDQLENLYVGPLDLTPAGQPVSLVDLHKPDLKRFPKFEIAMQNAMVAELDPGDVVFVPSMWWHHVEALSDFNVLVNYWWINSPDFLGAPLPPLLHTIMSLRNLSPEQKRACKTLFDYYVFESDENDVSHIPEQGRGILGDIDEQKAKQIKNFLTHMLK